MANTGRLVKFGALGLVLAAGCSDQDAANISKVSHKALDKANLIANQAGDKIGVSLRAAAAHLDNLDVAGRVYARLKWDQALQGSAIKVTEEKATVTLTGTVRDDGQRQRANELAQATAGVDKVTDSLTVDSTSTADSSPMRR